MCALSRHTCNIAIASERVYLCCNTDTYLTGQEQSSVLRDIVTQTCLFLLSICLLCFFCPFVSLLVSPLPRGVQLPLRPCLAFSVRECSAALARTATIESLHFVFASAFQPFGFVSFSCRRESIVKKAFSFITIGPTGLKMSEAASAEWEKYRWAGNWRGPSTTYPPP